MINGWTRSLSAPGWVVIQLTEICNLRCRMCYEWGEKGVFPGHGPPASLPLPVAREVIRDCLPAKPHFELFGGEPLLYDDLEAVVRMIKEGGCSLEFPTNGVHLARRAGMLVDAGPDRLWVSLDGPREINDRQRGDGVYRKAVAGIRALLEARKAANRRLPKIGVACIVTPLNHAWIETLFLECIDLSEMDHVSIEFQNYITPGDYKAHSEVMASEFGADSPRCARGFVRDPAAFAAMDFESVARQMRRVQRACNDLGTLFFSRPGTIDAENFRNYFTARWDRMADKRSRCPLPWMCAEISARGDVTTCHALYDAPLGNVHEEGILTIWKGERMKQWRARLRKGLLPVCTACCQYHLTPACRQAGEPT